MTVGVRKWGALDPVSGRDAHATTMHCVLIWRSNMCNLHTLLVIHKYRSAFSTIFVHLFPSFNTSNCSGFTINEWLVELGRRLGILRAMGSLPSNILGHKYSIFHFHFSRFPRTILTLNSQKYIFHFSFPCYCIITIIFVVVSGSTGVIVIMIMIFKKL